MAASAPPQSIFVTASDGARVISDLSWMLVIGSVLLLLLVMVLLVRAARGGSHPLNAQRWLIGGGIVLPVIVLTVLLAKGLRIGAALTHAPEVRGLEVEVIARRWWWEFRYRDPAGAGLVVLANELHLPVDCVAVLKLMSEDVIHSFWVPALAGKVDLIPGRTNELVIHASRPGRFRGQCAEYCGTQHANMALEVVVQEPEAFRQWLLVQSQPARVPRDALALRGRAVFLDSGCAACHTIRGTAAAGRLGPDLTHMAGRRMLAAATLPNAPDELLAWLRDAQHAKPGNLMPGMPHLAEADLRALVHYLAELQ